MSFTKTSRAPLRVASLVILMATSWAAGPLAAQDEVPLSLDDAVARALEKNETLHIERTVVDAAEAAVNGAQGAYDPLLGVNAGWSRSTPPVNSAFSGAPSGELAPTDEVADAGASVVQLLPSGGAVTVRASSGRTETNGAFGLLSPAYDSQLGVELRQPLLRNRAIDPARLRIRVAASDRDRAVSSLRGQVLATVADVERAYWVLVATRRAVAVQEEAVGLAKEQLDQTQIRIEGGAAPETEIAQPRAELERRRGDLLATREQVARAENDLKLLILSDEDTDLWGAHFSPVEEAAVEPTPVDVVAAMAQALESRPELHAAAAVVERRKAETAFAENGVLPALDLVASYDRFGLAGARNPNAAPVPGLPSDVPSGLEGNLGDSLSQLADGDFDDARVALVFEVPLGNRSARADARIAADAERQAVLDLARARKAVRAEVLDAAATLETAEQRIDAARSAREAAEVQWQAERERYSVGLSTNFLVLTRQNDLASARLAEIEALTDYRAAKTEMARATGSLLEERHIQLEDGD